MKFQYQQILGRFWDVNYEVGSQTASFRFMMQLEDIVSETEEKPFHGHIVFPLGEETSELHILLGHGKGTLGLNGTVDAQYAALF